MYRISTLKIIFKKVNEYINNLKGLPYTWYGRYSTVKISVLPKMNCSFNTILIKIPENILLSFISLFENLYGKIQDLE